MMQVVARVGEEAVSRVDSSRRGSNDDRPTGNEVLVPRGELVVTVKDAQMAK